MFTSQIVISVVNYTKEQSLYFFSVVVELVNGYYVTKPNKPSGWTHIVVNYYGSNSTAGIKVFFDGTGTASDTVWSSDSRSTGDGRIVLGRRYTDQDRDYASVMIDELIYFNKALGDDEINVLFLK